MVSAQPSSHSLEGQFGSFIHDGETSGIAVFPDVIMTPSSGDVAGFRPQAQELRVLAAKENIAVHMVKPSDAAMGQYTEHDASLVLPVVMFLGAGASSIRWNIVSNWVWDLMKERPINTLRFRYAEFDDQVAMRMYEIEGSGRKLLRHSGRIATAANDGERSRWEGLRAWRDGIIAEMFGMDQEAESFMRIARDRLVDAFLCGRKANADLFTLAHRIGRHLEATYRCRYDYDEEHDSFTNPCSVESLHSRMGVSVAWTWQTKCSVCGAGDFECDHITGGSYDGALCHRNERTSAGIDHIALTPNPDFGYTFKMKTQTSHDLLEREFGRRLAEGESLLCHHCRDCAGVVGEDDLEPGSWPSIDEMKERPRTENLPPMNIMLSSVDPN